MGIGVGIEVPRRSRPCGVGWSGDDLVDGGDCVIGRVVFD